MGKSSRMRITLFLEDTDDEIVLKLVSYPIPPGMEDIVEAKFRGDFSETVKFMENLIKKTKKAQ